MNADHFHIIAFYLPQYHPIAENDCWFSKGFTEWTNVGKCKPLFKGHYQPKVPGELGYYDLRLPEVREAQADLAKEAGISAFCYYHYWFGKGKQLMEMPINEVVKSRKPDFPFCLCWANHSFYRKNWNPETRLLQNELLLEQTYPGQTDIEQHFYSLLPIFKDDRYYKIDQRLVFVLYDIKNMPDLQMHISIWNDLAEKEGLPHFFFISYTTAIEEIGSYPFTLTDATILSLINEAFMHGDNKTVRVIRKLKEVWGELTNQPLQKVNYAKAIKRLTNPIEKLDNVIPSIVPNWDLSPRRGAGATIMYNSTPELFKTHALDALHLVMNKPVGRKIIFIKSWNEWGEGNYMEPDLKYGRGYIDALHEALECISKFNGE